MTGIIRHLRSEADQLAERLAHGFGRADPTRTVRVALRKPSGCGESDERRGSIRLTNGSTQAQR